jgi:hypothetical protein
MAIYDLLEQNVESLDSIVIGETSDDSKCFSWYGCDSCYLDAGKRIGNDIQSVIFTDVKRGQAFDFDLCDSCICEFHYPSNDADEFNADENNHVTELGV